MEKLWTFILTLLWARLAVNVKTTANPRKPVFKSTPDKINPVLVGRNIKLEWSFKFPAANDLRRIQLFRYDLRSKAKGAIASKDVESGAFAYNPVNNGYKSRYVCKISYEKNGVGKASISIRNVQYNHTYDYGVKLEMTEMHLPAEENSVSLEVVDMVLRNNDKSTKTIRSWFGEELQLECDVIHDRNIKPLFTWFKKSPKGRKKNLFAPNRTRTFVIKKINETDFGEYTCKAKTRTTVTQTFKVDKLGFAGSPRNVEYKHYPKQNRYALYWEQPSTKDGHWVKQYVLEQLKASDNTWMKRGSITKLHVTISGLESTETFRICSKNEVGYAETSCSKPITLGKTKNNTPEKRGNSSRFWPSTTLIVATGLLSGILSRKD